MKKKYFEMYDHQIVFTNNSWKSYEISYKKTPESQYELETNRDIISEVCLKIEFGAKFGEIIIKEFNKINEIYNNIKHKSLNDMEGYGRTFEVFAIATLYKENYEDVINKYIVDGENDGKIDAIYYNDETAIIYQIKMSTISDDVYAEMEKNFCDYSENYYLSTPNTSDLELFLNNNWIKIRDKEIIYKSISKNSTKKENILPKKIYIDFLKNKYLNKCDNMNCLSIPRKSKGKGKGYNVAQLNKNMIFVFVKATELISSLDDIIKNESDLEKLFFDNVRGYLGENSIMVETLEKEPQMFCFYNNGISILGDEIIEREYDVKIKIKNPKVINGQQTILNLYNQRNNNKIDFGQVYIPIFIKKIDSEYKKVKIAKYNNTQKKINAIDLLSLDANIRKIQYELFHKSLLNDSNNFYYLMIYSSGIHNNDKELKSIYKGKMIKLSEFVKLYSVLKNKNTLGDWKNNYNSQVVKYYEKGFPNVPLKEALNICKLIINSKKLIKLNKGEYQIADLAIQYLLSKTDLQSAKKIIDSVNEKSKLQGKKLADAYKSNKIINQLEALLIENEINVA